MTRRKFLKVSGLLFLSSEAIQAKMTLRAIKNNTDTSNVVISSEPIEKKINQQEIIFESEPYTLEGDFIDAGVESSIVEENVISVETEPEPLIEDIIVDKPEYKGYHQKKLGKSKTRSLNLYNVHTKEKLKVNYYKDGEYILSSLEKINHFFRDFRENETVDIDLKLLDLLHVLQKKQSKTQPLCLLSGYRTNKTNVKVGGAKHSEHKSGRAADIRPKYASKQKIVKLINEAKRIKVGGVGSYKRKGFVHVDSGRIRSWNG